MNFIIKKTIMKKIAMIIGACLCLVGTIQAQSEVNSRYMSRSGLYSNNEKQKQTESSNRGNGEYPIELNKYGKENRLRLSYLISNLENESDFTEMQGFDFSYNRDISLCSKIPFYVEFGLGMQYRRGKEEVEIMGYDVKAELNMVSLFIPITMKYNIPLSESFALSPYIGLDFRCNVYGYLTADADEHRERYNIFVKSDEVLYPASRFQPSFRTGFLLDMDSIFLGCSYSKDLTYFMNGYKLSNINFSLGCRF